MTSFFEFVEPCEISTYRIETAEYSTDSLISVHMNKAFKSTVGVKVPKTKSYSAMISFPKTDVDINQEVTLNNISDFISSVGGNLGLFTGFSFLSILLEMAGWYRKLTRK